MAVVLQEIMLDIMSRETYIQVKKRKRKLSEQQTTVSHIRSGTAQSSRRI